MCTDGKVAPDSWSKILFKYMLKTSPITIEHILQAVNLNYNVRSSDSNQVNSNINYDNSVSIQSNEWNEGMEITS